MARAKQMDRRKRIENDTYVTCACVVVHLTTSEILTTPVELLSLEGDGEGGEPSEVYCFDLTVPVYSYVCTGKTQETTGPEVLPAPFPYITSKLHQKQVHYY